MKITLNEFLEANKKFNEYSEKNKFNKSFEVITGSIPILISAPHSVRQIRNGKIKEKDAYTGPIAIELQKQTNCYCIYKTKNNNDDANFDENCEYKNAIKKLIVKNNIKFIIDFHGLSSKRKMDINLGTHIGKNVENNLDKFNSLYNDLKQNNFIVTIDQPFMATRNTISSSMKRQFHQLFTIQIEINCAITNNIKNFRKYQSLLTILTQWINSLK